MASMILGYWLGGKKADKDASKYEEYANYLDMEVTEFETDKQIVTDDFAAIWN